MHVFPAEIIRQQLGAN